MRILFIALLAASAWSTMDVTPAEARDYPFCIKGRDYDGFGDCSFDTYRQCQATASGRLDYCEANPFFSGYTEEPRTPRQRRRARTY